MLQWTTRGNLPEVKIVLASVVAALAVYQVLLMLVGYGKVRVPFLDATAASRTHRAVGDTIVVLTLLVAVACISYFEVEDENVAHAVAGTLLLLLLCVKIAVVRGWMGRNSWLPWLGTGLLLLFLATWFSSAAAYLL